MIGQPGQCETDVVLVCLQAIQPHGARRQVRFGSLGERRHPPRQRLGKCVELAIGTGLLAPELEDRFEHAETHIRIVTERPYEAVVHEGGHTVQHVDADRAGCRRDDLGVLQPEPAGENGQPAKKPAIGLIEQLVAPVDRAAQRALAIGSINCRYLQ